MSLFGAIDVSSMKPSPTLLGGEYILTKNKL